VLSFKFFYIHINIIFLGHLSEVWNEGHISPVKRQKVSLGEDAASKHVPQLETLGEPMALDFEGNVALSIGTSIPRRVNNFLLIYIFLLFRFALT